MNIVLDMDGVLVDFARGAEKLFGRHQQLPEMNITKEQWKAIDADNGFWLGLKALPGATYLSNLGEVPENIYILTSRNEKKVRSDTLVWLRRHDIDIPAERVLFANPRAAKVAYLEKLAPARFLDDSIANVDFCGTIRDVDATLMLQPYNAACALKYFPSMAVTSSVENWIEGKKNDRGR